jgi:hypothetical protein
MRFLLCLCLFVLTVTLVFADGAPNCVKCGNSVCCIDPPGLRRP